MFRPAANRWRRWLVVLAVAAVLVGAPLAVRARPVRSPDTSAVALAALVAGSRGVPWSGFVQSVGALPVPDSASFANLSDLLGQTNELRAWWRSPTDWRVDRIRNTGEADLFRRGDASIRWVFESETATLAPVSTVRLPDASDLLPPTLGRSLLQGVRGEELARLPGRRVAGVDAPGLRLTPQDPATSVAHVDLWADPGTGVPLRVELFGRGDRRPVLSTALLDVDLTDPPASTTRFSPPPGTTLSYEDSVDVAAAANAFAPVDLPATLAGLPSRNGSDPGAVGVYGRGPTTLIALPLRDRVADPLRERLAASTAAAETSAGTLAPVGPVSVLVTPAQGNGAFLLAGTVTARTLETAAATLGSVP